MVQQREAQAGRLRQGRTVAGHILDMMMLNIHPVLIWTQDDRRQPSDLRSYLSKSHLSFLIRERRRLTLVRLRLVPCTSWSLGLGKLATPSRTPVHCLLSNLKLFLYQKHISMAPERSLYTRSTSPSGANASSLHTPLSTVFDIGVTRKSYPPAL